MEKRQAKVVGNQAVFDSPIHVVCRFLHLKKNNRLLNVLSRELPLNYSVQLLTFNHVTNKTSANIRQLRVSIYILSPTSKSLTFRIQSLNF